MNHQKTTIQRHLFAAAVAGATLAPLASADVLWTTNPDMPTLSGSGTIGPSVETPVTNKEVADDFNVMGLVEQVVADGDDCPGCFSGQPVTGVYVRFYEWTDSGPGELQSEQFLSADDPNFGWTPGSGPEFLEIILPEPFQATGWHFVSVQVTFSDESSSTGKWSFYPINWGATMGGGAVVRDNGAGGAWSIVDPVRDASFMLIGTPGGPPPMGILTATSEPITPSSRLRITGDGFGDAQGDGQVLINDVPAIVTTWTDTVIVAYVPEQTPTGQAMLTVINDQQEEDALEITVLPREADGPVQWRFAVDADIMQHRPGLAPDGSIYINDYNHGRLYKLTPEGGLVWVVDALRGQIGLGSEGPTPVDDDGTVYVAVNPLGPTVDIVAFNSDGTVNWVFTNPHAVGTLTGPAIGPDGNIYATFSITADGQMGVISLTPEGDLRWFGSGDPFINQDAVVGAEMAFSSSTLGGPIDQIVCATSSDLQSVVYGLSMEDGDTNWSHTFSFGASYLIQLQVEAATGSDGAVYLTESNITSTGWGLRARHPADGQPMWVYDPGMLGEVSAPAVGSNGVIYISWGLGFIGAVTPDGEEIWQYDGGPAGVRRMPAISPDNEVVVFGGGPFGESGFIKALDATTGEPFLHVDLETSYGDIFAVDRPTFTPDSTVAYYPTGIVNDPGNEQCYLYALQVGEEEPGLPQDLDGDGTVGFNDLIILLASWGPCAPPPAECVADIDGDGTVGFGDLLSVLSAWGMSS